MSIVGLILCFEPISLCISTINTVYCLQIQIYGYTGGRSINNLQDNFKFTSPYSSML
ncbi:unnamed protein product [Brassica rapa subsp. narinosa]